MIELKIDKGVCGGKFEGSRLDITAESIICFMELAEAIAAAKEISFDSAALLIYQNAVMAKKSGISGKPNE